MVVLKRRRNNNVPINDLHSTTITTTTTTPKPNRNDSSSKKSTSLPYGDGVYSPRFRLTSFFSPGKKRDPAMSVVASPTFFDPNHNVQGGTPGASRSGTGSHTNNGHQIFSFFEADDSKRNNSAFRPKLVVGIGFVGVIWCFILTIYSLQTKSHRLDGMQAKYFELNVAHQETVHTLHDAYTALLQLEQQVKDLESRNVVLQTQTQIHSSSSSAEANHNNNSNPIEAEQLLNQEIDILMERRRDALHDKILFLNNEIQDISRREALEWFGSGPHRVEFAVSIDGSGAVTHFMVEMASLDVMPHSVHLFLQMVSHHLWDDTMFLHGADHVIQATPTDFTTMESKRSKFAEQEIKSLSFQEYNDSYPHKKYTLGFSGRPGGPEFYINTMDNTAFHGPGGQDQHALSHEADPCFATIVEGFDVVDLMHEASMEHLTLSENMDNSRMRRSRLISARIV